MEEQHFLNKNPYALLVNSVDIKEIKKMEKTTDEDMSNSKKKQKIEEKKTDEDVSNSKEEKSTEENMSDDSFKMTDEDVSSYKKKQKRKEKRTDEDMSRNSKEKKTTEEDMSDHSFKIKTKINKNFPKKIKVITKEKMEKLKRPNMSNKTDRRHVWRTNTPPLNKNLKQDKNEVNISNEERNNVAKLALRLQLNGVLIKKKDDDQTDSRIHKSRVKNIITNNYKEPSTEEKILAPKTQEILKGWNHDDWSVYETASMESEFTDILSTERTGKEGKEISDIRPILYLKLKGVMAKAYVDQGAEVSVIAEDFIRANEIKYSTIQNPIKLRMANGIIEPAFHRAQNLAIVIEEYKQKINAYIAPIKNYDLIIGRDTLSKWGAILDLRSTEDIVEEKLADVEKKTSISCDTKEEETIPILFDTESSRTPNQGASGVSVYNKKKKERVWLTYNNNHFITNTAEGELEKTCISEDKLCNLVELSTNWITYEINLHEINKNQAEEITESDSTAKEQEKIIKEKFKDIMKEELPDELPPDRGIRHYIDLQGRMPRPSPRGFKMSQAENEFMIKNIQGLLDKGLIKPCMGPYASPILVVKKPHSTDLRVVIDYRKLNEVTVGDEYPQPLVSDLLDKLKGAKYFSKMDLLSGFHQVRMAPEDAHKTAFTCPLGTYAYNVMPMGLKNASKTFQRMVECVLREYIGTSVIVFIDDILVFSKTLEEHQIILEKVLNKLRESKLYLKPNKCEFFKEKVTFLGHVVSLNKIEMDPKKIQIVKDWGALNTKKDVQRFLGFANFYRRFIKGFAQIAAPLYKLLCNTKDNAKLTLNEEAQKAQKDLIDTITSEPVLTVFDGARPLKVVTDASKEAVAAVLLQYNEDEKWHPVEFQSRSLDGDKMKQIGEYNLAPRDLELCAISYALTKFRAYLAGIKFSVVSDHRSLTVLEDSKINSGRLARILEQLSEFDFTIEYSEGTSPIITVVDALSRLPRYRKIPEEDMELAGVALYEILGMDAKDKEVLEKKEELSQEKKEDLSQDVKPMPSKQEGESMWQCLGSRRRIGGFRRRSSGWRRRPPAYYIKKLILQFIFFLSHYTLYIDLYTVTTKNHTIYYIKDGGFFCTGIVRTGILNS